MIDWYLRSRNILRSIQQKAVDALQQCEGEHATAAKTIATYMQSDFHQLRDHWYSMFPEEDFGYLGRHIAWGKKNDFHDIIVHDLPAVEQKLDQHLLEFKKSLPNNRDEPYVTEERIAELSEIESTNFDTSKLIRLLRELNSAYNNDCYLSVGILMRAAIDHVPPIFGCNSFPEVANNYKGTKSFKGAMQRLNDSLTL